MSEQKIQKACYKLKVMGRIKPSKRNWKEKIGLWLILFLIWTIY